MLLISLHSLLSLNSQPLFLTLSLFPSFSLGLLFLPLFKHLFPLTHTISLPFEPCFRWLFLFWYLRDRWQEGVILLKVANLTSFSEHLWRLTIEVHVARDRDLVLVYSTP